jgi:aminopeptidase N
MPYNIYQKSIFLVILILRILSNEPVLAVVKDNNLSYLFDFERPILGPDINTSGPQADTSGIDIHYLRLDIKANDTTTYVEGTAYYQAEITRDGLTEIVLDLSHSLIVDSLFVDEEIVNYAQQADYLTIYLAEAYSKARKFDLQIFYRGASPTGGFFSGISSRKDFNYGVPVTWTLSEPFGARDWFPSKQVLTDKIDSVDMNITTPDHCLAGSNGNLISITTLPDGSKCHHWKSRYPIDYYLISITVSDFQDYRIYAHPKGSIDSLLVQNYIFNRPAVLPAFKAGIDRTVTFIELFASLFGPYPFDKEKYGHCLAPIGGGMEHQTMTTLSSFEFGLVAHELCHMWFGDHVTCASWQDIWLNEGFASYGEYLAHHFIEGNSSGLTWIRNAHETAMLNPNGSVYVPLLQISDENRIFSDPLSYKKGASIIHMLRYEVNDDSIFFNILREYGKRFAFGTATGEDFRKITEELSGKDFQWFFNQWYYGEGYPIINVSWNQKAKIISINTEQSPSASTPLFKTSMDLQLQFAQGDTTVRIWMDDIQNHFEFFSNKEIISVNADPDSWLLKKTTVLQLPEVVDFKIGPNPFSSMPLQVNFYTGSISRLFRLTDINGRVMSEFISSDKNVSIDSSILYNGIYFLNIVEGDKSWQVKIVKD